MTNIEFAETLRRGLVSYLNISDEEIFISSNMSGVAPLSLVFIVGEDCFGEEVGTTVGIGLKVDPLYDLYLKGTSIGTLVRMVAEEWKVKKTTATFTMPRFEHAAKMTMSYELAKDNLLVEVRSTTTIAHSMLESCPYTPLTGDLVALYSLVALEDYEGKRIFMAITNDIIANWDIDVETLHKDGLLAMQKKLPPSIVSSDDVGIDTELPCFYLSNDENMLGLSSILYPEVLDSLRRYIGEDLYVLPLDVNGACIIPKRVAKPEDVVMTYHMVRKFLKRVEGETYDNDESSTNVFEYTVEGGLSAVVVDESIDFSQVKEQDEKIANSIANFLLN